MAIQVLQALQFLSPAAGATSATISFAKPPTAGNSIIVAVAVVGGVSAITVSDTETNTYSNSDVDDGGGSVNLAAISSAHNISVSGGVDVTVSFGGTTSWFIGTIMEVSGLASSPLDQTGTNSGTTATDASVTASGANAQADELVVAVTVWQGSSTNVAYTGPTTGYQPAAFWEDYNTIVAGHAAFKIVSASETSSASWSHSNTGQSTWNAVIATYKAGTSAQDLTPSLFTDTDTFFSSTITVGSVSLLPSLFTDTDTFHAATVVSTYALTPDLFADGDSFHSPAVTVGAVTLDAGLFTDSDSFHDAAVTAGAVDLTPSLFSDTDTFFSATISTAAESELLPSLFVDADAFYASTVSVGAVDLAPALYTDTDTFFSAAVSVGAVVLAPVLFNDTEVFFASTVSAGAVALAPALFADADAFFSSTATTTITLSSSLFVDDDTFFSPTITTGAVTLAADLFVDTDVFFTHLIGGSTQGLTPALYVDPDSFFSAVISQQLREGELSISAAGSASVELASSSRGVDNSASIRNVAVVVTSRPGVQIQPHNTSVQVGATT